MCSECDRLGLKAVASNCAHTSWQCSRCQLIHHSANQCSCSPAGGSIIRSEALRISRETMERAERDCRKAGVGGTHWLSGCACQERRHALLEAEHALLMEVEASRIENGAFRIHDSDWDAIRAAVKAVEDAK